MTVLVVPVATPSPGARPVRTRRGAGPVPVPVAPAARPTPASSTAPRSRVPCRLAARTRALRRPTDAHTGRAPRPDPTRPRLSPRVSAPRPRPPGRGGKEEGRERAAGEAPARNLRPQGSSVRVLSGEGEGASGRSHPGRRGLCDYSKLESSFVTPGDKVRTKCPPLCTGLSSFLTGSQDFI